MHQTQGQPFAQLIKLSTVAAVLLLVVSGMSQITVAKDSAREAELKQNLHHIQLSVERFAVDNKGTYPEYLVGGEARFAAVISHTDKAMIHFHEIQGLPEPERVSDPLLREGYADAYPANPFAPHGLRLHDTQAEFPWEEGVFDPMRNGTDQLGCQLGTRFGAECGLMGNVLGDPRYHMWISTAPSGMVAMESSGADVAYPCWDRGEDGELPFWLPGQFFYKSIGAPDLGAGHYGETSPLKPTVVDQYILGGYGDAKNKGKDVIGDELPLYLRVAGGGNAGAGNGLEVWCWTRSVARWEHGELGGSPFRPPGDDGHGRFEYGNPNGIRDGVALVLTAGGI